MQFVSDKVSKQRLLGHDWHQHSKPQEAGMSDFKEAILTPPRLQAATLAGRFMQPQSMSNAPFPILHSTHSGLFASQKHVDKLGNELALPGADHRKEELYVFWRKRSLA